MNRRRLAAALGSVLAAAAILFVVNGVSPGWEHPDVVAEGGRVIDERPREVRVLALNTAKCGFHRGGLELASAEDVLAVLDVLATVIRDQDPHLVLLSEVVFESPFGHPDQVAYLARACGFPRHVSAENYSFGWPFLRVRSGNAVLSRFELRDPVVEQLAGGSAFWDPTGNRRALWFQARLGDAWLDCASLRNDSFDLENNRVQTEEILERVGSRPALLGGDFNAEPHDASMRLLAASGLFTPVIEAPATFPLPEPTRRIDNVLAPASWTLLEHRVVDTGVSDHLAVVATFALP